MNPIERLRVEAVYDDSLFDTSKNKNAGLHPYMEFGEDKQFLTVTHLLIVKEPSVFRVNFEKVVDYGDGFASGYRVVPSYEWHCIHGLTDADINEYTEFVKKNVGVLMFLAREGGISACHS